jgi:DNA (cytosine-5)-methyltransferase 1
MKNDTRKLLVPPQFSCIDLFSGCGGNSWGMLKNGTTRLLKPLLALDIDSTALATYRLNMPGVKLMQADIRKVNSTSILDNINLRPGELGCLIASPPCQTYSRNNRLPKNKSDYRNTLYSHTLRIIKGINPWVVLMENVPEMETHNGGVYHADFIERLDRLGYEPRFWTVDSARYGVPQHRSRLIYLAYRKEMKKNPKLPPYSHGDEPDMQPYVTVADAIKDLPPRKSGDVKDHFLVDTKQEKARSAYARSLRPTSSLIVLNHAARELSSIQLQRLYVLKEGQSYDDLPRKLRPKNGYKASYGRLLRSKPAPTLTAFWTYPGCGRYSHYKQHRVITVREALRLQSFDDNFWVLGELMRQSAQVGNAVPPFLATAFKNIIVNDLESFFGSSI